jgi:hypothetical protein
MAYTYNYLGIVNRVLEDFNEVQLTNSTFSSATGFQGAVKDYVNDALNDVYAWNDVDWPFLWTQKTFTTIIGQGTYSYDATVLYVNWDSFNVIRPSLTLASLTSSGTTATGTVTAGHQLKTGDLVIVNNATQTTYNGTWAVTIVSPTVFTYIMTSTAVSPATGTPIAIPPYSNQYLSLKNYDEYLRDWRDVDVTDVQQDNTTTNVVTSPPRFIIRKPDNNFILSPYPDRIYTIGYDAFLIPTDLSASTDVPVVPSTFRQAIIDRVGVYCLAFRDNDMQIVRNDKKFDENCHRMRRILIPQAEMVLFKN